MLNEIEKQNVLDLFVEVLQSAYDADSAAMHAMVFNRTACNEALADHPSVVVEILPDGSFSIGLLGVINGICSELTGYRIAARVADADPCAEPGSASSSPRLLGFCKYNTEP